MFHHQLAALSLHKRMYVTFLKTTFHSYHKMINKEEDEDFIPTEQTLKLGVSEPTVTSGSLMVSTIKYFHCQCSV